MADSISSENARLRKELAYTRDTLFMYKAYIMYNNIPLPTSLPQDWSPNVGSIKRKFANTDFCDNGVPPKRVRLHEKSESDDRDVAFAPMPSESLEDNDVSEPAQPAEPTPVPESTPAAEPATASPPPQAPEPTTASEPTTARESARPTMAAPRTPETAKAGVKRRAEAEPDNSPSAKRYNTTGNSDIPPSTTSSFGIPSKPAPDATREFKCAKFAQFASNPLKNYKPKESFDFASQEPRPFPTPGVKVTKPSTSQAQRPPAHNPSKPPDPPEQKEFFREHALATQHILMFKGQVPHSCMRMGHNCQEENRSMTRSLLGIPQNQKLDDGVIKTAFKKMALKVHTDRNPHPLAKEAMQYLNSIRDILLASAQVKKGVFQPGRR